MAKKKKIIKKTPTMVHSFAVPIRTEGTEKTR